MGRPDLPRYADAARASSDELGAIGNRVIDYYTGKYELDEDTALFVASARTIVLDLIRYVVELETAINTVLDDEEANTGWGPDITHVNLLCKAVGREPRY